MSANFDPSATLLKDKARLRLADTGPTPDDPCRPFYLQDETYNTVLASYGYQEALAELCEYLASHFGTLADSTKEGDEEQDFRKRADRFEKKALALRQQIPSEPEQPFDPTTVYAQLADPCGMDNYRTN